MLFRALLAKWSIHDRFCVRAQDRRTKPLQKSAATDGLAEYNAARRPRLLGQIFRPHRRIGVTRGQAEGVVCRPAVSLDRLGCQGVGVVSRSEKRDHVWTRDHGSAN